MAHMSFLIVFLAVLAVVAQAQTSTATAQYQITSYYNTTSCSGTPWRIFVKDPSNGASDNVLCVNRPCQLGYLPSTSVKIDCSSTYLAPGVSPLSGSVTSVSSAFLTTITYSTSDCTGQASAATVLPIPALDTCVGTVEDVFGQNETFYSKTTCSGSTYTSYNCNTDMTCTNCVVENTGCVSASGGFSATAYWCTSGASMLNASIFVVLASVAAVFFTRL